MGSDLPHKPASAGAPRFIAWALKDPNGAKLDRMQIVKVWLNQEHYEEKTFDVAVSDERRRNPQTGKWQPAENTVDEKTGRYRNDIGASELHAVWEDPEFNASVPAVYYLRVLEIPTPRRTTLLAAKTHQPVPAGQSIAIQERGWASPIWYGAPAQTGKEGR